MKILLTNDDGVDSKGIRTLLKELRRIASVYIVAPDREQSTTSHSLTLHKPLRLIKVEKNIWKTNGTPIDCVKLGVGVLLKNEVDLVISGINRGANLGNDVLYSGTVAAAFEAAQMGITSLAVSLVRNEKKEDFNFAAKFVRKFINKMAKINLPHGTFLNLNFPPLPKNKIQGVAVTKLGYKRYKDIIEKRIDLKGQTYYWLSGEVLVPEKIDLETDISQIENGKISITPVRINLTDFDTLEWLKAYQI